MLKFLVSILVTATVYNAVPGQTDDTPLITASGAHISEENAINHCWVAVSRDLEAEGFKMGSKILVEGAGSYDGVWTIQDRMNRRWKRKIDFLVNEDVKLGKWENLKITLVE